MNQNEELTPAQLAKLTEIAKQVIAKYESLELIEILNRIHFITGLDYQRCIAGFKKMFKHGLIKPEFVLNAQRLPQLEKTIERAFPLIDAMKAEVVGVSEVLDGPTDDPEETEDPRIKAIDQDLAQWQVTRPDLSHLNTNF